MRVGGKGVGGRGGGGDEGCEGRQGRLYLFHFFVQKRGVVNAVLPLVRAGREHPALKGTTGHELTLVCVTSSLLHLYGVRVRVRVRVKGEGEGGG